MYRLKSEAKKSLYRNEVSERFKEGKEKSKCMQEKWNNIVNTCLEAAVSVVGRANRTKKIGNENIIALPKKQKQLREELNNTKDETGRRALKKRRSRALYKRNT